MSTLVGVRIRVAPTHRREWLYVLLSSGGLLLAILGQRSLFGRELGLEDILYFDLALALLVWVWNKAPEETAIPIPLVDKPAAVEQLTIRLWDVGAALFFALTAFVYSADNKFTTVGVLSWILSVVFFLAAFWETEPRAWLVNWKRRFAALARWREQPVRISWSMVAFLAIFLVGVFFYFYHLDLVPAEMTSDHAEKILDTYDVLHGARTIFFERNTGREPIQFYMNAAVVALGIAPLNHIALKIVTALLGLLTIPGMYLLARELFDEPTALLSSFFVAVSIWPVAIARIGLRYPLTPVFVVPAFFFLVRALKHQSRNDFLLAGLVLGAGLYGYNAFRFAPVAAGAMLCLWPFIGRNLRREDLPHYAVNAVLVVAMAFIVFIPLLHYGLDHPDMFFYRILTRVASTEKPIEGSPLLILADNTFRALQMFNVIGDSVWTSSVTGQPVVDYITGALVLVGAAYAVYRFVRFREWPYALVLVSGFLMLFPSTLSLAFPNENPSVVRAGGAIPFVMILAALPLASWWRQLKGIGETGLAFVGLVLLLFLVARVNYIRYFTTYDEQYRMNSWNSSEIGKVMREFADTIGDTEHAYLAGYGFWVDHRAVGIHFVGNPYWDGRVMSPDQFREQAKDPANKLYILNTQDRKDLALLQELYPNGQLRTYPARTPTREFLIFTVVSGQ